MQPRRKSRLNDLLRRNNPTAAVLQRFSLPTQRPTGPVKSTRQQHAQRTRLKQAADTATVARSTQRRLGRGIAKNGDCGG